MISSNDIKSITDKIVELVKPVSIYLFGSYAKGTPTIDSDIDLCIVISDLEKNIDLGRIRLSLMSYPHAFDLVSFSEHDFSKQKNIWWSIPSQIEKEGIKIYEHAA